MTPRVPKQKTSQQYQPSVMVKIAPEKDTTVAPGTGEQYSPRKLEPQIVTHPVTKAAADEVCHPQILSSSLDNYGDSSAYNDTFMPKKLAQSLQSINKNGGGHKKSLKNSSSEAALKPVSQRIPTPLPSNGANQQHQRSAQRHMDYMEVMNSFNLPKLDLSQATRNVSHGQRTTVAVKTSQVSMRQSVSKQNEAATLSYSDKEQLPQLVFDKSPKPGSIKKVSSISSSLTPKLSAGDTAMTSLYTMVALKSFEAKKNQQESKVYTPFDELIRQQSKNKSDISVKDSNVLDQRGVVTGSRNLRQGSTKVSMACQIQQASFLHQSVNRDGSQSSAENGMKSNYFQSDQEQFRSLYSRVHLPQKRVVPSGGSRSLKSLPQFKVRRRHDEKMKNFKLRLVDEERQRQMLEPAQKENLGKQAATALPSNRDLIAVQSEADEMVRPIITTINTQARVTPEPSFPTTPNVVEPEVVIDSAQAVKESLANDFHKYVQHMHILEQKMKKESERSGLSSGVGHEKSRQIDKDLYATPNLHLFHERRIVVNDQSRSLSHLMIDQESRQKSGSYIIDDRGKASSVSPKMHGAGPRVKNSSNVFALNSRDDSPLRTLFGVSRSKDFKVMHQLSTKLAMLPPEDNSSISIEELRHLANQRAQVASKSSLNYSSKYRISATIPTHPTNNDTSTMNRDHPLSKSRLQPLHSQSTTQNRFQQRSTLEALQPRETSEELPAVQQLSTFQYFRPSKKLRSRKISGDHNGLKHGANGSISQFIMAGYNNQNNHFSKVTSPHTSINIDMHHQMGISNMEVYTKSTLQGGTTTENLVSEQPALQVTGRNSQEGGLSQTDSFEQLSPLRPAQQSHPVAVVVPKPITKQHYQSKDTITNDEEGKAAPIMLLKDDLIATSEWKQVPIKQQDSSQLSLASSAQNNSHLHGRKQHPGIRSKKLSSESGSSQKRKFNSRLIRNTVFQRTSEDNSASSTQILIPQDLESIRNSHSNQQQQLQQNFQSKSSMKLLSRQAESAETVKQTPTLVMTPHLAPAATKEVSPRIEPEDQELQRLTSEQQQMQMTAAEKLTQAIYTKVESTSSGEQNVQNDEIRNHKSADVSGGVSTISNDQVPPSLLFPARKFKDPNMMARVKPSKRLNQKNTNLDFAHLNLNGIAVGKNIAAGRGLRKLNYSHLGSPSNQQKSLSAERHQNASPVNKGATRKAKKTKAKKQTGAKGKIGKILSGWSTDRHSINTESAIELFENSVLARNMADVILRRQDSNLGAAQMHIKEEPNNPQRHPGGLPFFSRFAPVKAQTRPNSGSPSPAKEQSLPPKDAHRTISQQNLKTDLDQQRQATLMKSQSGSHTIVSRATSNEPDRQALQQKEHRLYWENKDAVHGLKSLQTSNNLNSGRSGPDQQSDQKSDKASFFQYNHPRPYENNGGHNKSARNLASDHQTISGTASPRSGHEQVVVHSGTFVNRVTANKKRLNNVNSGLLQSSTGRSAPKIVSVPLPKPTDSRNQSSNGKSGGKESERGGGESTRLLIHSYLAAAAMKNQIQYSERQNIAQITSSENAPTHEQSVGSGRKAALVTSSHNMFQFNDLQ